MSEKTQLIEIDCSDSEADKGCRECGGEIVDRHWATLKWAAANWYCSEECASAVVLRANATESAKGSE